MIFLYTATLLALTVYSFVLVDPNITFFNSSLWEIFREKVVYIGYYQRTISFIIYFVLLALLFVFHFYFLKKYKSLNIMTVALTTGTVLLFSYPFLSHDFFNYMFDAKILTFYGKNPYLFKALDFPQDSWLRFMHWTHRTYPYGPVFLLLTLIPSFLSFGKFILSFFFFKLFFVGFYIAGVYVLNKMDKKWAVFFATSPIILIEGLINTHNDLIAVSLALGGIYYLFKNKNILARLFFLLSGGIKYITLPLVILSKTKKQYNHLSFLVIVFILVYFSFWQEIQPWYFLVLFGFLPYFDDLVKSLQIFFAGLLMSYYPYIALGGWDNVSHLTMKHIIIAVFFIANIIVFQYNRKNAKS